MRRRIASQERSKHGETDGARADSRAQTGVPQLRTRLREGMENTMQLAPERQALHGREHTALERQTTA